MNVTNSTKNKRIVSLTLLLAAMLLTTSCATMQRTYHAYPMKGSIVEATSTEVYLCVGTKDGAVVGQEFNVYKVTTTPPQPKEFRPAFKRQYSGKVRITQIIDEHFAKATIISGKADVNSVAEMMKP